MPRGCWDLGQCFKVQLGKKSYVLPFQFPVNMPRISKSCVYMDRIPPTFPHSYTLGQNNLVLGEKLSNELSKLYYKTNPSVLLEGSLFHGSIDWRHLVTLQIRTGKKKRKGNERIYVCDYPTVEMYSTRSPVTRQKPFRLLHLHLSRPGVKNSGELQAISGNGSRCRVFSFNPKVLLTLPFS